MVRREQCTDRSAQPVGQQRDPIAADSIEYRERIERLLLEGVAIAGAVR